MTRGPLVLLAVGAVGVALLLVLWLAGQPVLPSYLAAFLFVLAVPVGALPLVLGHDLLRRPETSTVAALRATLPLIGLAILMAVPLALSRAALYPEMATANAFAAAWMKPGLVALRGGLALLVWAALALVVRRPPTRPGGRAALAGAGLVLHLVLGTLVVDDWVAAIDPALNSSAFGLMVLVAQSGVALSVACLLVAGRGQAPTPELPLALLGAFGLWLFLQFSQYLVVWSANLPDEVPWYLSRDGGLGGIAEAATAVVLLIALATLLPRRTDAQVNAAAALILVVHLLAMFWLVVPAIRGDFSLNLADLVAALGLVGLAGGYLAILEQRAAGQGAAYGRP